MRALLRNGFLVNGALLVLLVVAGGGAYFLMRPPGPGPHTKVVPVSPGPVVATVSAPGAVVPSRTVWASFATAGIVATIGVQVGQRVQSGQVLARLDSTAATQQLDDAQRQLAAGNAQLSAAQGSLAAAEANASGAAPPPAAQAQVAAAQAQVAGAQAQVAAEQGAVDRAQQELNGTVLTAPATGTVTAINGTVGSAVGTAASSSATASNGEGGGSPSSPRGFIEIASLSSLQLRATFSQADTARLKVGQQGTATLTALPGAQAPVTLVGIGPVPATGGKAVTYPVRFSFIWKPQGLKDGQTARVSVVWSKVPDALWVPPAAVNTVNGQTTVELLQNGRRVTQAIGLGLRGDGRDQVTWGLTQGDRVVVPLGSGASSGGGRPGQVGKGGGGHR